MKHAGSVAETKKPRRRPDAERAAPQQVSTHIPERACNWTIFGFDRGGHAVPLVFRPNT